MQNHSPDPALRDSGICALRRSIKADAAAEDPPITIREIAAEMGERDPDKDGSYNPRYLGEVLNGHEDGRPHVPDYLGRARAALDALLARRCEPTAP